MFKSNFNSSLELAPSSFQKSFCIVVQVHNYLIRRTRSANESISFGHLGNTFVITWIPSFSPVWVMMGELTKHFPTHWVLQLPSIGVISDLGLLSPLLPFCEISMGISQFVLFVTYIGVWVCVKVWVSECVWETSANVNIRFVKLLRNLYVSVRQQRLPAELVERKNEIRLTFDTFPHFPFFSNGFFLYA